MNAPASSTPTQQPHPSPHRDRVRDGRTWFALLGAPLAWALQFLVNTTLVGQSCFPNDVPLAVPRWIHLGATSIAIEIVALAICAAAGVAGWRNWSLSRREKEGDAHNVVESGDGRTRFMALCAMMTSALFFVATLFAALPLFTVRPCGG